VKIDEQTRFPHPVLWRETGDYEGADFSLSVEVTELPESSELSLQYGVSLTQTYLRGLVAAGAAGVGMFVSCAESYFSELIQLGIEGGAYVFPQGALIGRVAMRPMIWATRDIEAFSLAECHSEYGGGTCRIAAGSVLGLDDEIVINVGREKLAQVDTIFSLVESEDLPAGTFSIQMDGDRIRILSASDLYGTVNQLRGLKVGKPVVLNSVYLPAAMEVLDTLRSGAGEYEGRRWHRVFTAKCDYLGINPADAELWRDAQKLLQQPFSEVLAVKELLGE